MPKAVEAVCVMLGLGNAWAPTLQRLEVDLSEPMAWRRRFLADTEPVTVGDLRIAALRMRGLGPTRIASRIGRRSLPPRHHIDRACLAIAVRLADTGLIPKELRAGGTSQRLVHDGIPSYAGDPVPQCAFDRLWLQGLPLETIRAELSIGLKVAKTHAAAAPPRWVGKEVAAFLGWSRENHRLRLSRGYFPEPDGRDGVKDWWWPATVIEWAASQPFVRCPKCNASVLRLKQHLTKHTPTDA